SGVPLGEIRGALATLTEAAGSAADAGLLDRVGAAYRPDATIGGAYVTLLRGVLEPLGIAVLDASHPATRRAAEPVLRRALARAEAVERCLEQRAAEIAAAGHAVQVEPVAGLSLVFSSEGGLRRRLPVREA